MKMSGLLSRPSRDVAGTSGTARLPHRGSTLPRRMSRKDFVLLNLDTLSADDAKAVVDADVAFVVNLNDDNARAPRAAYRILAAAGVPVLDDIPQSAVARVNDGDKLRIDGTSLFLGERELATGTATTASMLLERSASAESVLVDSALNHYADSVEFLQVEHSLLLDGEGVPALSVRFDGSHVLVVTDGPRSAEELAELKPFIREYRPIVIGVDGGAELCHKAHVTPDLVVGDASVMSDAVLRSADEIVLPADRDGRCGHIERITDLGLGAVTFPAMAPARDLAVLLAHHGGAHMIVTTGEGAALANKLAPTGLAPSTSVVNMLVGDKLVGATACSSLYRSRGSALAIALIVLVVLALIAAALMFQDQTGELLTRAAELWNSFALWVQGLFK